jgi:sulfonate transport system permease protein
MSSAGLITGETRITSTAPAAIKAVGTPRPDLTAKFWRGSLVLLAALALPAAIFVLWHEATARQWISLQVLPPPAWVFNTFIDLLRTGEILANIQISFTRIAWGLMIGASLGFLFGLLIGFSRQADSYLGTTFRAVVGCPFSFSFSGSMNRSRSSFFRKPASYRWQSASRKACAASRPG